MIKHINAEIIQRKYVNYFGIEIGWNDRTKIMDKWNIRDDTLFQVHAVVVEEMRK